ncbi:MAG TPA: acyl-CoA desaturase [Acidimicrobiales bacterium]|nr:acyl-CoA desaturase [Acidimicrobiales bacterium]
MQTIAKDEVADDFRTLALQVRAAGLLGRRLGYYLAKIALTLGGFALSWLVFFALSPSWAVLGVAAFLGLASAQLGFVGHDAGHGQVFASRQANSLLGLAIGNGLIGMSFGWWVTKHNAHHAHPNQVGRDPDVGVGPVGGSAGGRDPADRPGLAGWLDRWGVELFFPLMLLRSTGLYVSGIHDLIRRRDRRALIEGLLITVHGAVYLTVLFWVLPPLEAVAFIIVHQAVFSVYLGCSFAPNHKGRPLIDDESDMGFAQRQVITARNVTGGRCTGFVLGGLNYQIEHHLFPTMPRPNLSRAQDLVRAFCIRNDFGYSEERPVDAYRMATMLSPEPSGVGRR